MEKISEFNKKTYDALASQYELKVDVRRKFNEGVIDNFIKYLTMGKRVLDLGCAVGLDTSIFLEKGFSVMGLEISNEMVKFAKERNPDAEFVVGDFMKVKFDKKFDAIFAQAFIHLFPKEEAIEVIKKIKSLLNKNGVAHITTSLCEESREGWFVKKDYSGDHKRFRKFWTKNELEKILEQSGFEIINYYEISDPYDKKWMVFTLKNSS